VHINSLAPSVARRACVLMIAAVIAAAIGSILASQAHAGSLENCDKTQLAQGQFCVGELSSEYLYFIYGDNNTNQNEVCVGPVRWTGKAYEYPYGWSCGGPQHTWTFEPIPGVQPAVENPNTAPEAIGGLYDTEPAPSASTAAATNISSSGATLQGTNYPEEHFNAYYYFEYGKTTSYGSATSEQSAGEAYPGAESKAVSSAISSLEEGTTYHYRLVLKWTADKGTHYSYGVDGAFTTLQLPAATTESPTTVMQTESTLHGAVTPHRSETHYWFEYGTSTSYGILTAETSAGSGEESKAIAATVSNLEPATPYHYRLVAKNAAGTTYGSDHLLNTTPWLPGGTSCSSSSFCASVGKYTTGTKTLTLGENWTGKEWVHVSTYYPPEGEHSEMLSVSCTSSSFCMAVGKYWASSHSSYTLAEEWNGKEWSHLSTYYPPEGENSELLSVSCTSSSFCVAVGKYWSSSRSAYTLGEEWNGKEWVHRATYYPPEGEHSELLSVSCASSSFCAGVGKYITGSKTVTLGENWNGKEWVHVGTYYPSEGEHSELLSVSCTGATPVCQAVGKYMPTSHSAYTLGEEWNGKEWVHRATYYPPEGEHSELLSVSCASSSLCAGVGKYITGSKTVTLGENWNGKEWVHVGTYYPSEGEHSELLSVSCTGATPVCQAVGKYMPTSRSAYTLGEEWNGKEWVHRATYYPPEGEESEI
jgi:hypothetical protein